MQTTMHTIKLTPFKPNIKVPIKPIVSAKPVEIIPHKQSKRIFRYVTSKSLKLPPVSVIHTLCSLLPDERYRAPVKAQYEQLIKDAVKLNATLYEVVLISDGTIDGKLNLHSIPHLIKIKSSLLKNPQKFKDLIITIDSYFANLHEIGVFISGTMEQLYGMD